MTRTTGNELRTVMPARIESFHVRNYRALKSVEFRNLTPLTVLLGSNGSGKSTIFDVFNFLSECFQTDLRRAWDARGRAKELKTRGADGPVTLEIKYRERPKTPVITYHLAVDEEDGKVFVAREWLEWRRGRSGRPFKFLDYVRGEGAAIRGEMPDASEDRISIPLTSPDLIAVNALGQIGDHPRIAALRKFITGWYVSYLSVADTKGQPEAGPQERLNKTGSNLANVVQHLKERHPDRLDEIFKVLQERVPRLERILTESMPDGRLLLQIKDAPFDKPVLSRFASDGTLKMLAYLTILYDPEPSPFIGIEEPENFLHPRLLPRLAEECRRAAERSQLLATTHSPFFLDPLKPREVRILYRDASGFTQSECLSRLDKVSKFIEAGASLGDLWSEGHFDVGDPLVRSGDPTGRGNPE